MNSDADILRTHTINNIITNENMGSSSLPTTAIAVVGGLVMMVVIVVAIIGTQNNRDYSKYHYEKISNDGKA